jgi:hypothetical protein
MYTLTDPTVELESSPNGHLIGRWLKEIASRRKLGENISDKQSE